MCGSKLFYLGFRSSYFNTRISFDLPEDVFQPGETRPQRPKKKIIKKSGAGGQKRGIESLDVSAYKKIRVDYGRQATSTEFDPSRLAVLKSSGI